MRRGLAEDGERVSSQSVPTMLGASSGLIEDGQGLTFQHIGRAEAEFLYEEIFVRRPACL